MLIHFIMNSWLCCTTAMSDSEQYELYLHICANRDMYLSRDNDKKSKKARKMHHKQNQLET